MIQLLLALLVSSSASAAPSARTYPQRPKLIVVLVVDQLRGDFLTRFKDRFLPAGTATAPGGFRFLTSGAWYPFAEYDVLQSMTCPGHAMILTGARPAALGIGTNDWFDPATKKLVYCVDDAVDGFSPRRLRSTTLGDELKGASPKSQVAAISVKDRSAIMLGGHRANVALWVGREGRWETSSYYGKAPAWVDGLNAAIAKGPKPDFDKPSAETAAVGVEWTFEAALKASRELKLGRDSDTDLLAISLSTHDVLGHALGPNSPEMEKLTLIEDKEISKFLRALAKDLGGLDDTWLVLTSDHGAPPSPEEAQKLGLQAGRFDYLSLYRRINQRLGDRFGSTKEEWIIGTRLFHFFLNQDLIRRKKLDLREVENEARAAMREEPGVHDVFTRGDHVARAYPPGTLGEQVKNSYVDGQSGDLVLIPRPFFLEASKSLRTTHITGWSYDRAVPLAIWGKSFKAGVFSGGKIVDLAPTLAFSLGILPPAMNEGRVLGEALK